MLHQITWPVAWVLSVALSASAELLWRIMQRLVPAKCNHAYVERMRSVVKPRDVSFTSEIMTDRIAAVRALNEGSTTILFVCSKCGAMVERRLTGVVLDAVSAVEKEG